MTSLSQRDLVVTRLEERASNPTGRFVEMQLSLVGHSGSSLLTVGGIWDLRERRYTTGTPVTEVPIGLANGQVAAAACFAHWLARHIDQRRQEKHMTVDQAILASWGPDIDRWFNNLLLYGGRGSGKTFLATLMAAAYAIALPKSRLVLASAQQRHTEELQDYLGDHFLSGPWRTWASKEAVFTLVNGSTIELRTANRGNLKVGDVHFALLNECQEIAETPAHDLAGCTARKAGLTVYTGNPPRRLERQWFRERYEGILEDTLPGWVSFHLAPEDNPNASTLAMASIANSMDEQTRAREVDGDMGSLVGDVVFHTWRDKAQVRPWIPAGWKDCTSEVAERWYDGPADIIGGLDWDKGAGPSWVKGRFWLPLPELRAVGIEPGEYLDMAVLLFEEGQRLDGVSEKEFPVHLEAALDPLGYHHFPKEKTVFVADASGMWQGSSRSRAEDRDPEEMPSWAFCQARGFRLIRPDPELACNPRPAERRFELGRQLLRPLAATSLARVQFLRQAKEIISATKQYPNKGGRPFRRSIHAHLSDCWTYVAYRRWGRSEGRKKQLGYQGQTTSRAKLFAAIRATVTSR